MHLIGYDKAVYEKERIIIEEQVRHLPNLVIIASDISKDAIKIAKINADVACFEDLIDFQVCDFEATEMPEPEEGAIVMINPEYGERLGEELVLHWAKIYKLPALSLRFFNVYGTRSRTSGTYGAVFGVFLAQKLANQPFTIVGDGEQTRDFTYVTDVVRVNKSSTK